MDGEELIDLREKYDLSQEMLSDYLEISQGYLSRLEKNQVKISEDVIEAVKK